MIYSNPDPDALGAAWALRKLMQTAGTSATIVYTGQVGRPENEAMIELLRIPAFALDQERLGQADLIALVDSQPGFFKETELPRCDIVFDHHPVKGELKVAFRDIRPKCLATSSILTEYLKASDAQVDRRLATALYYGIQTDSKHLQRAPTEVDTAAMAFLEKRINRSLLRRIEFSSYSLNVLDYFSIALIRLRHSRGALYSHLGPVPQ